MAPKNNPFHHWLGLAPENTNPHHFQLLRVSPKLADQAEIEKLVAAGVARNLGLLAQVPAGKYDQLVAKLKARIATAEKTLLDPKLRAQYKQKLKTQIASGEVTQSSKANPELMAPPSPTSAGLEAGGPPVKESELSAPVRKPKPPLAGKPVVDAADSAAPIPAAPVAPAAPTANVPQAAPIATPASIPQAQSVPPKAVPLAVPMQNPQMAVPVANAAVPQAIANAGAQPPVQAGSFPPSEQVDAASVPAVGKISVQKVRRRRSSLVGPIFMLLMLGAAVGGSVLIYQNFDELVKLGRGSGGGTATNVDETGKEKLAGKAETEKAGSLGKKENESMPKQSVAGVAEDPDSGKMKKPTPGQETMPVKKVDAERPDVVSDLAERADKKKARKARKALKEKGKDSMREDPLDVMVAEESPTEEMPTEESPGEEMPSETEPPKAEPVVVSMDQSQLAHVRRDLDRAYRGLYRRETQVAKKSFESASAVLEGLQQSEDAQFVPEQQALVDRVGDFKKLMSHVDGFWKQVHKSAESLSGAPQIIIGSQIVGFVESKPQSIIIKRAGSNIEYQYSFCPPGLAVAIAEQGAVEDIPTWNIQKAAFYTVDQLGGLDHSRRINEFLEIAEEAGHNCEDLRRAGRFDLGGLGLPAEKTKLASTSKTVPAVEQFRAQHDYKNPRKLDGQKAYDLAELLFKSDAPDAEQRIGLLEEARLLAIQAGAASLAEDTIYELDLIGEIEREELACETYTRICTQKLQPAQVRQLMERAIGYLNSSAAQSVKPRSRAALKERLQKLAGRYRMLDAARRLEQIEI